MIDICRQALCNSSLPSTAKNNYAAYWCCISKLC